MSSVPAEEDFCVHGLPLPLPVLKALSARYLNLCRKLQVWLNWRILVKLQMGKNSQALQSSLTAGASPGTVLLLF